MTTTTGGMPPHTLYHRWMGWHAPAGRRTLVVAMVGLVVAAVLLRIMTWQWAVVGGWDAATLAFLATVWPIIARADGAHTEQLATREDETRANARLLLLGACVVSLLGVGSALNLAGRESGALRVFLIGIAVATVTLSWTVVNTVFTLRYAHLHFVSMTGGVVFGAGGGQELPSYRDFAYVAFTIGMTYQVSDTMVTAPQIRRTVLSHGILAYVYGVVIVAGAINLIAGLLR